jgi:hypothetical protein
MSGLYLTLWDTSASNKNHFDEVLKPTTGGWPHITVMYSSSLMELEDLYLQGCEVLSEWVMKTVTLTEAKVNTFTKGSVERHDVLISVDRATCRGIEKSRERILKTLPSSVDQSKLVMREPHVTSRICTTRKEAEDCVTILNSVYLPRTVTIVGLCMN